MESVSDLLIEDDDEPIEAGEKEEDDDKAVGHDLVAGLHCFVVVLQFLGSHVDVVFTPTVRQPWEKPLEGSLSLYSYLSCQPVREK